ncbi:unnamed protein product [Vitrella brassicaformis CCMP3155]|uniref:C2 domain-containing protein n=3 Tax=Vitrella brassicaformis TaxID=1169539 RepID=A0A0G4GXX6_VITBC|nr:unnamed protein product [Vitrella brassicaformis CCMP3155]|eukprot:CEM35955.1 unnamed protein product [Vitrella brassicaformis CCMP3155]
MHRGPLAQPAAVGEGRVNLVEQPSSGSSAYYHFLWQQEARLRQRLESELEGLKVEYELISAGLAARQRSLTKLAAQVDQLSRQHHPHLPKQMKHLKRDLDLLVATLASILSTLTDGGVALSPSCISQIAALMHPLLPYDERLRTSFQQLMTRPCKAEDTTRAPSRENQLTSSCRREVAALPPSRSASPTLPAAKKPSMELPEDEPPQEQDSHSAQPPAAAASDKRPSEPLDAAHATRVGGRIVHRGVSRHPATTTPPSEGPTRRASLADQAGRPRLDVRVRAATLTSDEGRPAAVESVWVELGMGSNHRKTPAAIPVLASAEPGCTSLRADWPSSTPPLTFDYGQEQNITVALWVLGRWQVGPALCVPSPHVLSIRLVRGSNIPRSELFGPSESLVEAYWAPEGWAPQHRRPLPSPASSDSVSVSAAKGGVDPVWEEWEGWLLLPLADMQPSQDAVVLFRVLAKKDGSLLAETSMQALALIEASESKPITAPLHLRGRAIPDASIDLAAEALPTCQAKRQTPPEIVARGEVPLINQEETARSEESVVQYTEGPVEARLAGADGCGHAYVARVGLDVRWPPIGAPAQSRSTTWQDDHE